MIEEIETYWKNEPSTIKKLIFFIGWISLLTPLFWVVMIIYNNMKGEDKFWNINSLKIVYIFGWIVLIPLVLVIVLSIFGVFYGN